MIFFVVFNGFKDIHWLYPKLICCSSNWIIKWIIRKTDVFQVVKNFVIDTEALQIWILWTKPYSRGFEMLNCCQLLHKEIYNYSRFVLSWHWYVKIIRQLDVINMKISWIQVCQSWYLTHLFWIMCLAGLIQRNT